MVEGPGARKNCLLLRTKVGATVVGISGKFRSVASPLAGGKIVDALVLGKEVWCIVRALSEQTYALRLHFGMSGSLHLDTNKPSAHGTPSLSLCLILSDNQMIRVFNTGEYRGVALEKDCDGVYTRVSLARCRDVCSDKSEFSAAAVVALCQNSPSVQNMIVADAMLDQVVVPGSGNIIKNESMARAKIHPNRRMHSLNQSELSRLVACIRDFSMEWVKGSGHSKLRKIVYNMTVCGVCDGEVTMAKLGETTPRATFWCNRCCTASSSSSSSSSSNYYKEYTIFIDPIDGTREFINRQGNQCTICIGIANTAGKAVGGVVYRPLSLPHPTWATGVQDEDYAICNFFGRDHDSIAAPYEGHHHHHRGGGLLTTNGPISPFITQLITTLDMDRIKSGGAGNKMLLLLEHSLYHHSRGAGDRSSYMLYIQDRGVSRWDTCAAEAILYAFGGQLTKLTPYLAVDDDVDDDNNNEVAAVKVEEDDSRRYKYLASTTNLDFIPGLASLTKNNCRRHDGTNTDFPMKGDQKIMNVEDVKVYSNLCGFVAFGPEWNTVDGKECIAKAIQKAAIVHPPSFN